MNRHTVLIVPLLVVAVLFSGPVAAEREAWMLGASEWSRPRSGAAVIGMQPVADAVRAWEAHDRAGERRARLQLLHASGEEGGLWAAELRDWLVALGIPAGAIEILPGGLPADRLELRVVAGAPE